MFHWLIDAQDSGGKEVVLWSVLAVLALGLLGGIVAWESHEIGQNNSVAFVNEPNQGRVVFANKGCTTCHGADGQGTPQGPVLRGKDSLSSLPKLVTAMWNHAPGMWRAIDQQKITPPEISYQEMGQIVSYLYFSRYAYDTGDPAKGAKVFRQRQCVRCHSIGDDGAQSAPELTAVLQFSTPIDATQKLWNHAAGMQTEMQRMKIEWPQFQPQEFADLLAYARSGQGQDRAEFPFPSSDPENGWLVFKQKGCIKCHTTGEGGLGLGTSFGATRPLPDTFAGFGSAMLNHFPAMQQSMQSNGQAMPVFKEGEMADLVGFIYSLHCVEPSGSPLVGASVFAWRGCAECHGPRALGTRKGPGLRGRGQFYTANRLATNLWGHGIRMYRQNAKMRLNWPTLEDSDVGNLLTFLNSPEH